MVMVAGPTSLRTKKVNPHTQDNEHREVAKKEKQKQVQNKPVTCLGLCT